MFQRTNKPFLLNPNVSEDKQTLLKILADSTEIATCLPSVDFYESGAGNSVASLIAEGLKNSKAQASIIYTAENNNHAAKILERAVAPKIGTLSQKRVQFLNTVVGKMSRVVTTEAEIKERKLETITPGINRAFLVEEFNRILVSQTQIADFNPGIEVFIEKDDLLPFEEAKLFGHNAIHTLLGFIGQIRGATSMSELKDDEAVMQIARSAFLDECGPALVKKHAHLGDELFTESGMKDFGTMTLALEYGIEPNNMALAAMAGIAVLLKKAKEYNLPINLCFGDWRKLDGDSIEKIIHWLWKGQTTSYSQQLIEYVQNSQKRLKKLEF
jgi:hypothetical protein